MRHVIALLSRLAIPRCGLREVLRNAPAIVVQAPEVELRVGIALLSRLAISRCGLRVVLWNAPAIVVQKAKIVLRFGTPYLMERGIPTYRKPQIFHAMSSGGRRATSQCRVQKRKIEVTNRAGHPNFFGKTEQAYDSNGDIALKEAEYRDSDDDSD